MSFNVKTATVAAAALAAPLAVSADEIRLTIGAGHPATAAWVATVQDYFVTEVAARVAANTEHSINWTEGYGGSICKLGECLETVESGLLDMALIGTAFEPSKLQAHNFSYFVPFGASDPRMGAQAANKVYDTVPELKSILEDDFNQVFVGVSTIGNYGLSTTFDWNGIKDLDGQKIAAAGPNLPWLEGTDLVPVQTTLNEAYTSLQTGVYHGWIMFTDALVSFKLIEVAPYYADMNFGVMAFPLLTMNRDTWDDLPEDVQEIIQQVGAGWSAHNAEFVNDKQTAALQTMRDAGVTFIDVTDDDRRDWANRLPNLPKARFDELDAKGQPGEAIYAYISILSEMGHAFPRDWASEK